MKTVKDSLGEITIDETALYGASTARAKINFKIGDQLMPLQQIYSIALVKKACALANRDCQKLSNEKCQYIVSACDDILNGVVDDQFVLSMYQSGSGTQSNMNVNEVIAGLSHHKLHPNDDVNMSQSTNDVFPTAMHLTTLRLFLENLLPALDRVIASLQSFENETNTIFKVGRTHLQDAISLSVAQEFSGYRSTLEDNKQLLLNASESLKKLAIGGTAVGTGLNTHPEYLRFVELHLEKLTGLKLNVFVNKFQQLSMKDGMTHFHHTLALLASNWIKIANDIRFLGSGPRAGLKELILPSNEPGSSIMPGKINPTQCEAMIMLCVKVLGNDTVMSFSNSMGNFELNVMMPLMIDTMIESISLLTDGMNSFVDHLLNDLQVNNDTLKQYNEQTLMNAAALNPKLGYDIVSKCVLEAHQKKVSLKEVVLQKGLLSCEEYDSIMNIERLVYQDVKE